MTLAPLAPLDAGVPPCPYEGKVPGAATPGPDRPAKAVRSLLVPALVLGVHLAIAFFVLL